MDSREYLKQILAEGRHYDYIDKVILFMAWLTQQLSSKGLPSPTLVGGSPVGLYTNANYISKDIDIIKGRMQTGYAVLMDIDGNTVKFEAPKTAKLKDCYRIAARNTTLISMVSDRSFSKSIPA